MGWLVIALVACGAGRSPQDGSVDSAGGEPACESAEPVTWEGFARAFFDEHCQGCHGSAAVDRQGAPVGVVFDTEEQVRALADSISAAVLGPYPFMPPMTDLAAEDTDQLEIYLSCP